jgi:hypothetical protein
MNRPFPIVAAALTLVLAVLPSVYSQAEKKKLAVINGEVVTEGQVEEEARVALGRLEQKRQLFELNYSRERSAAMEEALNGMLAERLIRLEAAKQKLSIDELLDKEV